MHNSKDGPDDSTRVDLLDSILRLSFQRGRFKLSSGAWSDYYLDLRLTTLDATGLKRTAALLWPVLARANVVSVGGPTLGADPIVAGLLLESSKNDHPMQGFLVRSAVKAHGTGRQIEGHCAKGSRVAVLDDVCTRGGSILRSIQAVRDAGAEPVIAMTMVDRDQGGREAIEAEGVEFYSAFGISEVLAEAERRDL